MLSFSRQANILPATYQLAFIKAGILALMAFCSSAFASQVSYHLTTEGGLYASNLELLGAVADAGSAQYIAEMDVYFTAEGQASGRFTYDNQANQYLALSGIEAGVGGFLATSTAGGIVVADGVFHSSIPYDPSEPGTDGLSLHLGNELTPGFSSFSIGDWTLNAIAASWFGGEFITGTDHPLSLPPPSGYETNVLTFIFNNASGDTAIITAAGMEVTPVPLPAAVWLFGSALVGLAGVRKPENKGRCSNRR